MYRVGDIRRKNRRRLRRRIIASAVIVGLLVFAYLIVFKNGLLNTTEGMPDTIVAVDTTKESLHVGKRTPDTVVEVVEKQVQKDTPIIPVYTDIAAGREEARKTDDQKREVVKTKSDHEQAEPKKSIQSTNRGSAGVGYKVRDIAYFYNEPNEGTRRKAYINHWNNSYATLEPSDERDGFIFVVFTNHLGQTSRGWLRKKDLKEVPSVVSTNRD